MSLKENKETVSDKAKDQLNNIAILAIVLVAGLLLSKILEDTLNIYQLAMASTIIIGLVLVNTVIVGKFLNSNVLDNALKAIKSERDTAMEQVTLENRQMLQSVDRQITSLSQMVRPRDFEWLFPHAEMTEMEKSVQGKVWLVSPDLDNDTGDGPLVDSVRLTLKSNAERGIEYTYIVPDTIDIKARLKDLYRTFDGYDELLKIVTVPADRFTLLADTHVLLFNPDEDDGPTEGYMELPLAQRGWWVQMSAKHAGRMREIVIEIMDEFKQSELSIH
jgi:hypothetical protein